LSKRSYEPFKRGLDVVVALSGLLLSLPFWPFLFLAIKLSSTGPVFFKQRRLGREGKLFTLLKFRTMRTEQNDFAPTAHGDPRITLVGKILRGSRLDELPQLFNILLGDMSFVGPRPERPELAEELAREIPFYYQRLLVKPGLTGWDQVSGEYHSASVDDTYKKLQYDLYYLKNMSPLLDLSIFLKTIMTVLMRIGR
jgi:lipopolysaccharide/colanic/teichoic acid biosynthesis glycosyltransferase